MGGDNGLNRIEAAVAPERDDHVPALQAVIAQEPKSVLPNRRRSS